MKFKINRSNWIFYVFFHICFHHCYDAIFVHDDAAKSTFISNI